MKDVFKRNLLTILASIMQINVSDHYDMFKGFENLKAKRLQDIILGIDNGLFNGRYHSKNPKTNA